MFRLPFFHSLKVADSPGPVMCPQCGDATFLSDIEGRDGWARFRFCVLQTECGWQKYLGPSPKIGPRYTKWRYEWGFGQIIDPSSIGK